MNERLNAKDFIDRQPKLGPKEKAVRHFTLSAAAERELTARARQFGLSPSQMARSAYRFLRKIVDEHNVSPHVMFFEDLTRRSDTGTVIYKFGTFATRTPRQAGRDYKYDLIKLEAA